jgi:hypothetical protein
MEQTPPDPLPPPTGDQHDDLQLVVDRAVVQQLAARAGAQGDQARQRAGVVKETP